MFWQDKGTKEKVLTKNLLINYKHKIDVHEENIEDKWKSLITLP